MHVTFQQQHCEIRRTPYPNHPFISFWGDVRSNYQLEAECVFLVQAFLAELQAGIQHPIILEEVTNH